MSFLKLDTFSPFFCLFFLLNLHLHAQSGLLTGTVVDADSKETLVGATVRLVGVEGGTYTDINGFYALRNIPAGTYSCVVSYYGYSDVTLSGVEVKAEDKTTLDVVMSTNDLVIGEVTIVEYKKTNSVAAVLLEVRQSKEVVSGISSQQIQRSQDNNAAEVVRRVPGVTIADNRFVMVRGLSERYNNVMINNVTAPSTEVDKRTFSFDLIPTNVLDRMLIYKSGAAEYPGDYAGAVIKLFTIDEVDQDFTRFNIGTGFRVNTTFQPHFQTKGSPTDFLGFDNGYRKLPGAFPTTRQLQESARNAQIREDAAHSLPNNWQPLESIATPDYNIGFSLGRNTMLGSKKLTSITAVNYSTTYQHYNRSFNRFFAWVDQSKPIDDWLQYTDNVYEKQSRISLMSNWKLRLTDRSRITFKNLFNQIGENETILRTGFNFLQRPQDDLASYLFGYRSRLIYTGQLEGVHELSPVTKLQWVLGTSYLRENEPDLRRFRTYRPKGQSDENFTIIDPPSSNLFDTGRYFGKLNEISINQGASIARTLSRYAHRKAVVKGGYYGDFRNRNFDSRYVSYLLPGYVPPATQDRLRKLPLSEVFSNPNVNKTNGWVLEEGTRGIDSYQAYSITAAAYGSGDASFGRLDLSGGLRGEYNVQNLSSEGDNQMVKVNNPTFFLLPFLNTAYNLNDRSLVRFAYSKTINRPEFRELAPFVFFDYKLDANRVGEPNLKSAQIHNLDLRYEVYPRAGETFSVGTFFKYFNDPIENRTIITTELPTFSYINADWARSLGTEVEFRKSLRGVTNLPFLDHFSINANASLIASRVNLGKGVSNVQDQERPLQGQSPYIVNLGLYYEAPNTGLNASIAYNIFGNRIYSVGDVLFPTIYELSRNSLDVTVSKRFGRTTIKLGVQNILDAPFRFYEDSDRNEKITLDGKDNPIIVYRRGQLASLSASFDLGKQ
jgi:hypothetical protein